MRRNWGLGSWGWSSAPYNLLASKGETVAEIVRLQDGYRTFFRGKLVREKPYKTLGVARLAAELALRKERP